MSKRELLVEDSGIKFNVTDLKAIGLLSESTTGDTISVSKVPSTVLDKKNKNGRIYTTKMMEAAIAAATKAKKFEHKLLLCTADDHPAEDYPQPTSSSHIITAAYIEKIGEESYLLTDWQVLGTTAGQNLKALLEAGAGIGTSIRGFGSQNEKTAEIYDYEFLGCDAVGNPSSSTYLIDSPKTEVAVESLATSRAATVIEPKVEPEVRTPMNLNEAIVNFKAKHGNQFTQAPTSEAIEDLIHMSEGLKEESKDSPTYKQFAEFQSQVLRPLMSQANGGGSADKSTADLVAEISNLKKQIEAADILTVSVKRKNDELSKELSDKELSITGANQVIETLKAELQSAGVYSEEELERRIKKIQRSAQRTQEQKIEQIRRDTIQMIEELRDKTVELVKAEQDKTAAAQRRTTQALRSSSNEKLQMLEDEMKRSAEEMVSELRDNSVGAIEEVQANAYRMVEQMRDRTIRICKELRASTCDIVEELRDNSIQMAEDMRGSQIAMVDDLRSRSVEAVQVLEDRAVRMAEQMKANSVTMVEDLYERTCNMVKEIRENAVELVSTTVTAGNTVSRHLEVAMDIAQALDAALTEGHESTQTEIKSQPLESQVRRRVTRQPAAA